MLLPSGPTQYLDSVESTQEAMKSSLAGIIWTSDQTRGRGRMDKSWFMEPGSSLAASFRFDAYCNHALPYLVGMGLACIVAQEFKLHVQWPNDIVWEGKKIGGVLTEIHEGVPIVGIGMNLSVAEFPAELIHRATSLHTARGTTISPTECLERIVSAVTKSEFEVNQWSDLRESWETIDRTSSKVYTLASGRKVVAQKVTENGHLLWMDGNESGITTLAEAYY